MRAPGADGERTERDVPAWVDHEGDSLTGAGGLAGLQDRSVDVVITDPPYEAEAHTSQRLVARTGGKLGSNL